MTEYRRNHTIPRSMLNYWIDPAAPHDSVHVFDIRKQKGHISTGRGSKAFSFAIHDDLHIPRIAGERAVSLEQWFSRLEGPLSRFLRQVHDKNAPVIFESADQQVRTLMALVALEYRSRYDLALIQKGLENDPAFLSVLTHGDGTPPKQSTLENLIHLVTEQVADVRPVDLNILHAPEGASWITCDRPCVRLESLGLRVVILTNKAALLYRRSEVPADTTHRSDVDKDFVESINNDIALNARDWIVADSEAVMRKYAAVTATEEWRQRVAADHLTSSPIQHLTSGWRIAR